MGERDVCDGGSSRRRRDRQLRAWHQHVKMTNAAELAAALHSAQPAVLVVVGPREGEVRGPHLCLRLPGAAVPVLCLGVACSCLGRQWIQVYESVHLHISRSTEKCGCAGR